MQPVKTTPEGLSRDPIEPGQVLVALEPRELTVLMSALGTALKATLGEGDPEPAHVAFKGDREPVKTTEVGILLNMFTCSDFSTD